MPVDVAVGRAIIRHELIVHVGLTLIRVDMKLLFGHDECHMHARGIPNDLRIASDLGMVARFHIFVENNKKSKNVRGLAKTKDAVVENSEGAQCGGLDGTNGQQKAQGPCNMRHTSW